MSSFRTTGSPVIRFGTEFNSLIPEGLIFAPISHGNQLYSFSSGKNIDYFKKNSNITQLLK